MPEVTASRYLVQAAWDDVPHLTEETKRELLDGTPPYLRAARSRGEPSLGSGAIYPIPIEEIMVQPFAIPAFWPRSYALDVGWNKTAALWGAIDPADGTAYLYAEHYMGDVAPSIHAEAVRARGEWIPGVMDHAARGRAQTDGQRLSDMYDDLGLDLTNADKSIVSGLELVWQLLVSGRIKVFSTLGNLIREYRLYRRDENGKIVKKNDHLMDCLRYWCVSGREIAITKPAAGQVIGAQGHIPADRLAGY